jgi:hypothetical protein
VTGKLQEARYLVAASDREVAKYKPHDSPVWSESKIQREMTRAVFLAVEALHERLNGLPVASGLQLAEARARCDELLAERGRFEAREKQWQKELSDSHASLVASREAEGLLRLEGQRAALAKTTVVGTVTLSEETLERLEAMFIPVDQRQQR